MSENENAAPVEVIEDVAVEVEESTDRQTAKLRAEAAKYRTRVREVEEERDAALKAAAEHEEALNQFRAEVTAADNKRERERITRDFGLPTEFAERLRGETPEEWQADANTLKTAIAPASVIPQRPKPGLLQGGSQPGIEGPYSPSWGDAINETATR